MRRGFTLIELSIVLIIVGLVIGGVLVGQDLIASATVRAQISELEKYQTAVNTFKGKYGYLPGDIPDPAAASFGFTAPRVAAGGQGDGNGLLQGYGGGGLPLGWYEPGGETGVFWRDLADAKLIGGSYSAVNTGYPTVSGTGLDPYFPKAKIGQGNYMYAWSDNVSVNYFGISALTSTLSAYPISNPGMTVNQAYLIDSKIDDGKPQNGNVQAWYLDVGPTWAIGGGGGWPSGGSGASPGAAQALTASSCYDNSNNSANPMVYSLSNKVGFNCAISIKFQ